MHIPYLIMCSCFFLALCTFRIMQHAQAALEKAQEVLVQRDRLPQHLQHAVEQYAAELEQLLNSSHADLTDISLDTLSSFVCTAMDMSSMTLDIVLSMYDRLEKLEQALNLAETGNSILLLRQIASQCENKVFRLCTTGITPKQAAHASIKRLKMTKQHDALRLTALTAAFPGLEAGVEALKDMGTPFAHPVTLYDSTGTQRQVTEQDLELLISKHLGGEVVEDDVRAVLHCLVEVSRQLQEPLFVATT
jgi:hypothetical protein